MTTNLYRVSVGKGDRHETMTVVAPSSDEARKQLEGLGLRVFRMQEAGREESPARAPSVDHIVEKVSQRLGEQLRTKDILFALWAIVLVLVITHTTR